MDNDPPSDSLRDVYELRAELQYGGPRPLPDPSVDRKFERIREVLLSCLPVERFLDAGCGDGRYLATLTPVPKQVVAVDISGRILNVADATARAAGVEPELVRGNLESLPFADESFDLVLCTQVVEHLINPRQGLR